MKAIGYFRETAERALAQQNKAFLEFCEREGHEIAGTFVDSAGSNGHAPGFRQMLEYLREREAGVVVVVPSVEAMGLDLLEAARRCFQIEGVGGRVTPIEGGEDLAGGIVNLWSAQEAGTRLSDRVRAAMRRKAVKGEVLGRPPYGYKVGSRRRLEVIPEEAVVVRYIFRLYLQESLGIRLIARRLNEEGLRTRRDGNWSMVSIRDILRNRVYLGTYQRFGARVPGNHQSLVSADDFRLVQDRLNARRTSYAPRVSSQFLLSGIVQCGYCGNRLIGVSRKQAWKRRSGERVENSYRYYQCESRTNQSVCGYHTRRADSLEAEVRRLLDGALASGGMLPESTDEASQADRERERSRIAAKLRAIDKRLEGYVEVTAKGRLSKERMQKLGVATACDRLRLEDAMAGVERRIEEQADVGVRRAERESGVRTLLARWDELAFVERQAALRDAIETITVTDDSVVLTYRP